MSKSRVFSFILASIFAASLVGCAAQAEEPASTEQEAVGSESQPLNVTFEKGKNLTIDSGSPVQGICPGGRLPPTQCALGSVPCGCYCKKISECYPL